MSEQRSQTLSIIARFAIALSLIILSVAAAIQADAIRDLQRRVGQLEQGR